MAPDSIPTVDLSAGPRGAADEIARASETIGFFLVTGHGVPPAAIAEAWAETRAFFALPQAEKDALAVTRERYRGYIPLAAFSPNDGTGQPDLYEGYKLHLDLGAEDPLVRARVPLYGANLWPPGRPTFRRALDAYWQEMTRLSEVLLRALALALDHEETHFLGAFEAPLSNLSLLHYPARPPTDGIGIHPHRDSDAFTVLLPDPVGGLQVQPRDGGWLEAPVVPGSFIVNLGLMMQRWTGGRFPATPHRVINRSGRARQSIAFFAVPSYHTVIRPLNGRNQDDEIHVGRFMEELYASNWA